jgi:sugar lactone lactonase YvrE
MEKKSLVLVLIASVVLVQGVSKAQFVNGQNADVVLGQSNFTSSASATTQSGMYIPAGVAVDPTTGKVFVADNPNNRVLRFSSAAAAISGSAAEAVLGQPNFTSSTGATTQSGMNWPSCVAVDASGNLYVAELVNNRVLRFNSAATKTNGANADGVLGQTTFTTNTAVTTRSGMCNPNGVAVDALGNLYVADKANSRVLRFSSAATKTNGANADGVLGQPNFTTATTIATPSGMYDPYGVAVDTSGNLYVTDFENSRVLRFNSAATKANGANADGVLGQPNFTSSTGATTQSGMNSPTGIAVDAYGNLYVAQLGSNRVLRFNSVATKANGANADGVLGQPDFTSSIGTTTQSGMRNPDCVAVDTSGNLYVADAGNNRVLRFNASGTLPVELASFSGKSSSFGVLLNWQTATEKNNAGFDVERSMDNTTFSKIGFVKGNGTTTQSHNYTFTDNTVSRKVWYRLKQMDYDGNYQYSKTVEVNAALPKAFVLGQNYPNPFNPSTTITYVVPQSATVSLHVYDVLGRSIATLVDEKKVAGSYAVNFDASKLASGIYFYKLQFGSSVLTKKMILAK